MPFEKDFSEAGKSMQQLSTNSKSTSIRNGWLIFWTFAIVSVILTALLLAWNGIKQYNEIQQLNERVGTNLDQVVNQYMRRADLIPKLNRVVESYSSRERELVNSINRAQALVDKVKNGAFSSASAEQMNNFISLQKEIDLVIGQFQTSYRNNKNASSTDLYMGLMVQIEGTENRISFARSNYIESINLYNVSLKEFPMQLFANRLGFEPKINYFKDYVSILKSSN